jgi:vancomycin resistance protein VanJ
MVSPKTRSLVSILTQAITVLLLIVWVAGQILRDRNWWMGLLFYFPTPVLVGWLLFMLAISRTNRRLNLLLLVAPLIMLLLVENHWIRPVLESDSNATTQTDAPSTSLSANSRQTSPPLASTRIAERKRLIHWNVARGVMGWEEQWKYIENLRPDIVVISEIPSPFDEAMMADFTVLTVDGMAIACHGNMTKSRTLVRGGALDAYHITCTLPEGPFELMIADMTSHVTVPRDHYLQPFVALLAERKIDISVGDFNAPRRSLAFCNLPEGFRHAYDEAGIGWSYTWPVPVPCLAIDQCIAGPDINVVHYELRSTLLSDHRLQILDFDWLASQ